MAKSKTSKRGRTRRAGSLLTIQKQLVAALRQTWNRYDPNKKQIKDDAKVYVPKTKQDGTPSKKYDVYYRCSECKELFRNRSDLHTHHKVEVGETPGWPIDEATAKEWVAWFMRLFTAKSSLICYCADCHHKIHGKENQ